LIFTANCRNAEEHKGEWNMDISDLPNGVYFVKIYTESRVVVKKVIKH